MTTSKGGQNMAGKKVLVVDDEIHIVHVVTIKLRNNGYDVISADNGADAYEVACQEGPDVIITDFQMPVMTGLELIHKLRENEATLHVPVIMLTARNFALDQDERDRLQIAGCISKPFSPRELLGYVEDVVYQNSVDQVRNAVT